MLGNPAGKYYALLWLSIIILGVNWPFMKAGLNYISPLWMASLRFGISAPMVALFILVYKHRLPHFERRDLPVILGVAILQYVVQMGLVAIALKTLAAGTASILIYTTPLWLLLINWIVFRQNPSRRNIAITLISAAGCALILFSSGQPGAGLPLLMILIASICWASSMRLIATHRWQGWVADALFWQFVISSLLMAPIALWIEGPPAPSTFSLTGLLFLGFIGPVASVLGFGLMVVSGQKLPVEKVALFSTAAPLIGYISATIILGEPVIPVIVIGGLVILLALILGARRAPKLRPDIRSKLTDNR